MENTISSDLIRGHIDTIILHTLIGGDKFAQQISETVSEKSENKYDINQATLYSSLKRLENLKYVTSYWNDAAGGRRKYFKLTPSGKDFVESNLSSWSFSRAIIDKLMDLEPEPVIRTKIVEIEKVVKVEVPSPVSEPVKEVKLEKIQEDLIDSTENKPVATMEKTEKTESVQEINFRNILNGLIKATGNRENNDAVSECSAYEKVFISEEQSAEPKKFNETILNTEYNTAKRHNGKIDFGDVASAAEKEGYKIKISSKETKVSKGSVFINKIRLFSSLAVFLLGIIGFLITVLASKKSMTYSLPAVIVTILILAAFPAVMAFFYFREPDKTSKPVKADSVLAAAIIVFNFIVITLAINIFFSIDLKEVHNLITAVIVPSLVYLDIFCYFAVRYTLSKCKYFLIKES